MKINAEYILENYPKIKVKSKTGKLFEMSGDLFFVDMNGRNERVTDCVITESTLKGKKWIELEILSSVLQDSGVNEEDNKL